MRQVFKFSSRFPDRLLPSLVGVLLGVIFGLPHILIPARLGQDQKYTPFAIDRVSALTYDESYIYAAQSNYTRLRWKPAYDTDVYEYRSIPATFPFLPHYAIASIANLLGGTDKAYIFCDFLLPPLAFLLLYTLLRECILDKGVALLGSLATIVISFGPRNFFSVIGEYFSSGWSSAIQPLEYSRLLHPQFSFTLFLIALLLLWRAMKRNTMGYLLASGIAGGLLFYVYLYYWPVWIGTCFIVLLAGWFGPYVELRRLWIPLAAALISSSYFWVNYFESSKAANYLWRLARFGVELGHIPSEEKVVYTAIIVFIFSAFYLTFWMFTIKKSSEDVRPHFVKVAILICACGLASCGALNMELITGINIEAMEHYPNRVFQPLLTITCFVFVVSCCARPFAIQESRSRGFWRVSVGGSVLLILLIATFRQAVVGVNTTESHIESPEQRLLFAWLNNNTNTDDVVLLSVSAISNLVPASTKNCLWIPSGTRTTASNPEILRRFLVGMKLLGAHAGWVRAALAQSYAQGSRPLGITYVYYLFQGNFDSPGWRLKDDAIGRAVDLFESLDLASELRRFRLDYVYARRSETMLAVKGIDFAEVYQNKYGVLYRATAIPEPPKP